MDIVRTSCSQEITLNGGMHTVKHANGFFRRYPLGETRAKLVNVYRGKSGAVAVFKPEKPRDPVRDGDVIEVATAKLIKVMFAPHANLLNDHIFGARAWEAADEQNPEGGLGATLKEGSSLQATDYDDHALFGAF
jgi:hypothetical protein